MVLQLRAHQQLAVQQRTYIQGRKTKVKHAAFSVQRKLGQPWLTKVGLGMNEVAERCHLKIPEESNVADFEFLGKDSTRFRNRPLAAAKRFIEGSSGDLRLLKVTTSLCLCFL